MSALARWSLRGCRLACVALLGCALALPALAQQDDYDAMLGYLAASSRIDGRALAASSGAVRINQAAGDLNLQANLQGLAVGQQAAVHLTSIQRSENDRATPPLQATVAIAGAALSDANGLYAINQVAGSGNAQFNAVAATLAQLGIHEAGDAAMAVGTAIPAGGTPSPLDQPGSLRKVEVSASAMQGFRGVMQLSQIAGSGNETGNRLEISVHGGP